MSSPTYVRSEFFSAPLRILVVIWTPIFRSRNSNGPFSSVSKPILMTNYALESSRRDLQFPHSSCNLNSFFKILDALGLEVRTREECGNCRSRQELSNVYLFVKIVFVAPSGGLWATRRKPTTNQQRQQIRNVCSFCGGSAGAAEPAFR